MKRPFLPAVLVTALALGGAAAQPPAPCHSGPVAQPSGCVRDLLRACPDDYCRKPWPLIWRLPCGGPDDSCRKPWPRIWQLPCGGPDDYCRKPCPSLCRPLCPVPYSCGCPGDSPRAAPAPAEPAGDRPGRSR